MVEAQYWLDKNYPKDGICQRESNLGKRREEITELDISKQNLVGSLKITDFPNLQLLDCSSNQLDELDLIDCSKLVEINCEGNLLVNPILPINNQIEKLWCSNNQLTNLLVNLNPKTLNILEIKNNKLQGDLTMFSHFINLERLDIEENWSLKGSLAPLVNLINLKNLKVGYTQVDSGLEYLPESLTVFVCEGTAIKKMLFNLPKNKKGGILEEDDFDKFASNLNRWRRNNAKLVEDTRNARDKSAHEVDSAAFNTKNFLLIGKKGTGKSTLINNLGSASSKLTKISQGVGKNDYYQVSIFEDEEGDRYKIVEIDSFNFDDPEFSSQGEEKLVYNLAEAISEFENGISQVFFATDGMLNEQEAGFFGVTALLIGDENIAKYTTFIQTKFPEAEDEKVCQDTYYNSIERDSVGAKLMELVGRKNFIYVDNSPSNFSVRRASCSKLVNNLVSSRTTYQPRFLNTLSSGIKGIKNLITGASNQKVIQPSLNNLASKSPVLSSIGQAANAGNLIGGASVPLIGAPAGVLMGTGIGVAHGIINSAAGAISGNSRELSRLREQLIVTERERNNARQERDARANVTPQQWTNSQSQIATLTRERDARANVTPQQWNDARIELSTYLTGLRTKLGLLQNSDLPSNWLNQLALQSDLVIARNGLITANNTISNAQNHLGVLNLNNLPNMRGQNLTQVLDSASQVVLLQTNLTAANNTISNAQIALGVNNLASLPNMNGLTLSEALQQLQDLQNKLTSPPPQANIGIPPKGSS